MRAYKNTCENLCAELHGKLLSILDCIQDTYMYLKCGQSASYTECGYGDGQVVCHY